MSSRRYIYDFRKRLVGYIEGNSLTGWNRVWDKNMSLLGYVTKDGTYDKLRRKISDEQMPGLLLYPAAPSMLDRW